MRRLLIVALACLACAAVGARTGAVRTTTTCDAASPYDNLPDDAALQACLDAYDAVLLQPDRGPGYVGYLLASTLKIKRAGVLLTSAAIPAKATILAAPGLDSSMLRAAAVSRRTRTASPGCGPTASPSSSASTRRSATTISGTTRTSISA